MSLDGALASAGSALYRQSATVAFELTLRGAARRGAVSTARRAATKRGAGGGSPQESRPKAAGASSFELASGSDAGTPPRLFAGDTCREPSRGVAPSRQSAAGSAERSPGQSAAEARRHGVDPAARRPYAAWATVNPSCPNSEVPRPHRDEAQPGVESVAWLMTR